jgi:hypothetical protein
MQTLFKNLFNSINLLKISFMVLFTKIFQKPSGNGTLRYRKIVFFTTSALFGSIRVMSYLSIPGMVLLTSPQNNSAKQYLYPLL